MQIIPLKDRTDLLRRWKAQLGPSCVGEVSWTGSYLNRLGSFVQALQTDSNGVSPFKVLRHRRLPLKVGIFHDLKAALGGKVSPDQLSRALGTYCSAPDYQRHLKDGAARIDLDGTFWSKICQANWPGCSSTTRPYLA
jgi:ProQ/FINO family